MRSRRDREVPLPTLEEFIALAGELQNVSDRVVAISCAAWLDDTLGSVLAAHLVRMGQQWLDRVFDSPTAPLGNFSSKIVIGYAMGLFGPRTRADLEIIRAVRNTFAHTPGPVLFTGAGIAEVPCDALGQGS